MTESTTKKILLFILIPIFLLMLIVALNSDDKDEANQEENKTKTKATIKYQNGRIEALSVVEVYPIKIWVGEGTKYQISKGTTLKDLFGIYIEKGLINKNARWVVLKDGGRYVVMFRSEFEDGSLNNPQWAVLPKDGDIMSGEIKALNGTAIKYTPELGYQYPDLNESEFSESRKLYLRWMEIAEEDNYKKILESDDFEVVDKIEDDILEKVATEFNISFEEADKMFIEGSLEESEEVKKKNGERGNILSDEEILKLLEEQGDLYVPTY